MMTNGQTLVRIELYNWGNFHGLHTIDLYPRGVSGPLLAPPPASAILGINGSGKSTIIDGVIITLLPFETKLKLGVTNDYEKGSSGGRRGEDYVLGKFASTDGSDNRNPGTIFNRQNGVSLFQLTFQQNEKSDAFITVGSVWWYNNFKVSTRHFYATQSDIRIRDICPNDELPKNVKVFKENFLSKGMNSQTFDTAQSYFTILSTLLGGISKDDLKLFNRAFYVKSIENIDGFIRDNMLIEEENKNLAGLLENVSNGNQISLQIELCRNKLEAANKVLDTLERIVDLQDKMAVEQREKTFVQLFQYWLPICLGQEKLEEMRAKLDDCLHKVPFLEEEKKSLKGQISSLKDQLQNSETLRALEVLESQRERLDEKSKVLLAEKSAFATIMENACLKFSMNSNLSVVLENIQSRVKGLTGEIDRRKKELAQERHREHFNEEKVLLVKNDLAHLESHKTLIPRNLYDIKLTAVKELKIPDHYLMFVGETITVTKGDNRQAVEAALEPISRNLLVHPDCLDKVTSWLDRSKLNSSITVKRISHEELFLQTELEISDESSILSMISLRSERENPFYNYVIRLLNTGYAYRLVPVHEFKRGAGLLVTHEGLVKRDKTTMRKLKRDFSYSLGWNPAQKIAELTNEFIELSQVLAIVKNGIQKLETLIDADKEIINLLKKYDSVERLDFFGLPVIEQSIKDLNCQIEQLKKKDKDLASLRSMLEEREKRYELILTEMAGAQAQEMTLRSESEKIKQQLPQLKKSYEESRHFIETRNVMGTEEKVEEALLKARRRLEDRQYEILDEIEFKLAQFGKSKEVLIGKVSAHLANYQKEFGDPNLSYSLLNMETASVLRDSWSVHKEKLVSSELAGLQEKWKEFFNDVLINSIRDTLDEIKCQERDIQDNIRSINRVLALNHFEKLPTEERYLKIDFSPSQHEDIRKFKKESSGIEKIFSTPELRLKLEDADPTVIKPLKDFVNYLKDNEKERKIVTDVRNHFQFKIQSWVRKNNSNEDELVETFTGSRHDAKSSAQTTHLAYTLLASSLAYRFHFNDPVKGRNTPRMIILDEFGGKFDNDRPKDILQMLTQMGFQPILVSPMTKAEILADDLCYVALVHKASASKSKVQSFQIQSKDDYNRMVLELTSSGVVTT